jgi:acylphosphatase
MKKISKNILVKGFVQGVSYRKQTKRVALNLGVTGWVRNLEDGTVEACVEGEEQAVDALIAWCAFGPKKGKVDEVLITDYQFRTAYSDFRIMEYETTTTHQGGFTA